MQQTELLILNAAKMRHLIFLVGILALVLLGVNCAGENKEAQKEVADDNPWGVDFFDDFDELNPENWQDQPIWLKHEFQK